jgi:leader peptidase (prepilin peptidase) / N-methyltransferase
MGVGPLWAAVLFLLGCLLGPALRARIFHHAVPSGQAWRRECPQCARVVVPGLAAVLPPTGRCPSCRSRIGPPPFSVELATGVVLALLALRVSDPWVLAAFGWLGAIGVALWFVDVAVHRLPDQLTYAAFVGVLGLLLASGFSSGEVSRAGWAALNGLGMAAFYLLLILVYPAGMGLGDAKLALSLGTALGWLGWVVTVLGTGAGFFLAGLFAAVALALRRVSRKTRIPHGPFMLLGALATVLLLG